MPVAQILRHDLNLLGLGVDHLLLELLELRLDGFMQRQLHYLDGAAVMWCGLCDIGASIDEPSLTC